MIQPSFVRFLTCCPFGAHRPVECECCGTVSCLDCQTELPPLDAPPPSDRSEFAA